MELQEIKFTFIKTQLNINNPNDIDLEEDYKELISDNNNKPDHLRQSLRSKLIGIILRQIFDDEFGNDFDIS